MIKFVKSIMIACILSLTFSQIAAASTEAEMTCLKPVKRTGPANLSQSFANMKAIVFWTEMVRKKHGKEYAIWHYAKKKSVRCKKGKSSQYFYCDVAATPCAPKTSEEETAEAK